MSVKDTLAIEIKSIVEKIKLLLHFQARQFMLKNNESNLSINVSNHKYIRVDDNMIIFSWLVSFNILNTQSRFVFIILDFSYRATSQF